MRILASITTGAIAMTPTFQTTTGAPVINFAAFQPRKSAVQKLCAKYEATLTEFKVKHGAYAEADDAFHKAMPSAPRSIQATKRNLADLDYSIPGPRRAINSGEIRRSIEDIKNNTVQTDVTDGRRITIVSDVPFPLSKKQRARLARLEAKLPVALAYEAKCDALHTRFRVDELDEAARVPSSKLGTLAAKIADTPSQDRNDLLAKARIIELDPDMAEVSEDIGLSLAQDFIRLSAASLI
jgi:hypothetical protein